MIGTSLPPGTRVMCIDAKPRTVNIDLVEGEIYTIRGYAVFYTGYVSVLLNEVRARQDPRTDKEIGYFRDRFIVVQDHTIFNALLAGVKANTHVPETV